METENSPKKDLADELDSLRQEINHLLNVIQHPEADIITSDEIAAPGSLSGSILERSPFGLAILDDRFRIVDANDSFCSMLGYTKEDVRSFRIGDIAQDPHSYTTLITQVIEQITPKAKTEGTLRRNNGEIFWVQATVSPLPESGVKACFLIIEEIDDRKSAEAALENEKKLLECLINSSVDGILAFDCQGFFTVWNLGMERLFGISASETLGKSAFEACPLLKELGEVQNLAAALQGKKVISRNRRYSPPGTTREIYFEGYYGPMYKARDGEMIGGLGIIRDVTESTLAEQRRLHSEERYRELFENAYDMVYTLDLDEKITSINKAAERMTGYTRAQALQMRFRDLVAPEYRHVARRMVDAQSSDEAPATRELELVARDNRRITVEVSNRLIYREGRRAGIQGIARDVSERKKTEEALQEANRKLENWVRELEQRTRELTLLSEMGDILRACLTTEEVYEVIVRVAQELFPQQGGALFVLGPSRNIVESVAQWGNIPELETTFTPDECWGLRRGRIHWVEDSQSGLICRHIHAPYPSGYLCVPMMAQSEAVGVLHLNQPEGSRLPEAKQRLAMAMAEHVAMALSNLRLHETLRNQSIRDQLTGLFNRSFMEESLELELRRALRSQHPISVIMLELDEFQLINEKYGLDVGDSILRRTGMLLQANVRKGDIACRYTGHTYVIVLPQGNLEVGRKRAETLCDLLRSLDVKHQSAQVGYVTGSAGLAVFPGHGQTVESLLRSAEAALNRAKAAGGNSVVVVN